MDAITSQLSGLAINETTSPSRTVYLVGENGNQACFLHWSSDQLLCTRYFPILETFEPGKLYNLTSSSPGMAVFLAEHNDIHTNRRGYSISEDDYKPWVLRQLLLGCRVRDFEQSCATVVHRSPLTLTTPTRPGYLKKARFRADTGEIIDVIVEDVFRDGEKTMTMICTPIKPLPLWIEKESCLQFFEDDARIPIVTLVLESFYRGTRSIVNKGLLNRIYGEPGSFVHSTLVDRTLIRIRMKDGTYIILNAEQSESIRRFQSEIPAFAVESPPGSGKTMTAAAMAVSYQGPGLQLFLSTANVPVYNMAYAIDGIDHEDMSIVHLVSADKEAAQNPEKRSPFSLFAKEDEETKERIRQINEMIPLVDWQEKRELRAELRRIHDEAFIYDVILATVDKILWTLMKPKNPKRFCPIQYQLETRVRRVVIDEASQLTEAALNAIILSFPQAQIVLIGDSKQLPPFKYQKGDVVSELAAASALEVLKAKRNVPVITLRQVYRAAPSAMKHYSDCFYHGELVSGKPESTRVSLSSVFKGKGNIGSCLFIDVLRSKPAQSNTSKSMFNNAEIGTLLSVLGKLSRRGFDHDDVMIIAYYAAQRQLAADNVPEGFEVLTVDSAQGREKSIVIVLTTTDSPNDFFKCAQRCNVAMSRHKEALIVLGHTAILKTEPWKSVLKNEYFSHLQYKK